MTSIPAKLHSTGSAHTTVIVVNICRNVLRLYLALRFKISCVPHFWWLRNNRKVGIEMYSG